MIHLAHIRGQLRSHQPELEPRRGARLAAVAMLLRERAGRPEVLFIERAHHEGDPWSGHMALPGGRVDPTDVSERHAAERETLEEVGLSLAGADYLGRLTDLQGRHAGRSLPMVISAHVYHVPTPGPLRLNHEVEEAFWFPVQDLHDPDRHVEYRPLRPASTPYPGILVGRPDRHVVWGLTYRFLEVFFEVLERPLPDRWAALREAAERTD